MAHTTAVFYSTRVNLKVTANVLQHMPEEAPCVGLPALSASQLRGLPRLGGESSSGGQEPFLWALPKHSCVVRPQMNPISSDPQFPKCESREINPSLKGRLWDKRQDVLKRIQVGKEAGTPWASDPV